MIFNCHAFLDTWGYPLKLIGLKRLSTRKDLVVGFFTAGTMFSSSTGNTTPVIFCIFLLKSPASSCNILGLSHGIHDHPQYCCDLVTFLLSPVACLNARRGLRASCTTTARGLYKNYTCRAESKSGPCSPYMAIVGAVLMILFIVVPSGSHVFKAWK